MGQSLPLKAQNLFLLRGHFDLHGDGRPRRQLRAGARVLAHHGADVVAVVVDLVADGAQDEACRPQLRPGFGCGVAAGAGSERGSGGE
jgi:hypothetical protein